MIFRGLIALLAIFTLAACGSNGNNLEKLHGKWQMDKAATVSRSKEYGKMSKEMQAELVGRTKGGQLIFDVFAKQVTATTEAANEGGITLPFEVKKDSGDTLSLVVARDIPTKIVFEKDNIIVLSSTKLSNASGLAESVFIKVK